MSLFRGGESSETITSDLVNDRPGLYVNVPKTGCRRQLLTKSNQAAIICNAFTCLNIFDTETYGFYESHFMNESRVEDIIETVVEVSYNLKCQYRFWQSVKLRDRF